MAPDQVTGASHSERKLPRLQSEAKAARASPSGPGPLRRPQVAPAWLLFGHLVASKALFKVWN